MVLDTAGFAIPDRTTGVAERRSRESPQAALQLRILEYARAHLADPDLGAEVIATEHFISVRYLYKLLAEQNVGLANWIRQHRLEACRLELARQEPAPIAAVARRWGFSDMSSFSRAFRAEYGISPREWRARAGAKRAALTVDLGTSA